MSFGGNYNSSTNTPLFGLQDQMVSNSQQGVPVPFISGTRKVAAVWMSPIYNLQSIPQNSGKKGDGKKGGGGANQQYNYYGTVAGALAIGPVTGLSSIILAGQEVWPAGNAWSVGLSISAGQLYVYDAQTWVAQTNHTSSTANAPDNPTYWALYVYTPTGYFDDITIPIQAAGSPGKSKGAIGAPTSYGVLRIYWGTTGQPQDFNLSAAGNDIGDNHPAYNGLCYIVLIDFYLGSNTTTAPNLEFVLTRAPVQSVITGTPATLTDGQANLAASTVEVFTEQNLLGLSSGIIDSVSFQAAGNYLDTVTGLTAGSVLIDSQDTLRSYLDKVVSMTDSYIRFNPTTGLIEMGCYKHGSDPISYTTITSLQLTERPSLTNGGWSEVKTRAVTQFKDRTLAFSDNTNKADDPRAFAVVGEHRSIDLDRPFLTRPTQSINHAYETLKTIGRPVLTADLSIRREFARTIMPGDYILLDVDVEPNVSSVYEFFRVVQKKTQPSGPIQISVIGDNTLSPIIFSGGVPPKLITQTTVPAMTATRIIEAPFLLNNSARSALILAERPNTLINGFHLYFDTNPAGSFNIIGGQTVFAVKAALHANVAAGDATISIDAATQADIALLTNQPGDIAAADDSLLAFLVQIIAAGGDAGEVDEDANGYQIMEACSISASTLVSGTNYTLSVLRGRLGSTAAAFATATCEVWIVPRLGLQDFTNGNFSIIASNRLAGTTPAYGYFRLTPFTYIAEYELSSASNIKFHFPLKSSSLPTITVTAPASNPLTVPTPTYPYALTVSGEIDSLDGNLVNYVIKLRKSTDTSDRIVFQSAFAATNEVTFSQTAWLETAGSYTLTIIAYDANGISSTYINPITATGSGAKVQPPQVYFGGSPPLTTGTLLTPDTGAASGESLQIAVNYGFYGLLRATCQTPTASIKYRTQVFLPSFDGDGFTISIAWNGFGSSFKDYITTPPSHIMNFTQNSGNIFPIKQVQYEFKAVASGMTDSDSVYITFYDANF